MDLQPLLDTAEAAAILRHSKRTLESWRSRGGGPPFISCRGRALYRREDLAAFIAERRRVSTSDPGTRAA
jgi:hypothetical protein